MELIFAYIQINIGSSYSSLGLDMSGYTAMYLMTATLCALGLVLTGRHWAQLK